jgi:carbon-monoxide dehydrogenase large subunit
VTETNVHPTAGCSRYIGRALPRFEDLRLVRGGGRYTDDISDAEHCHAVFVRSPHAHARIGNIDTGRARSLPGVRAVLTGADYLADGHRGMPQMPVPAGVVDHRLPAFEPTPQRKILDVPHLPLAVDCVRYVGEAVAVVVADTLLAARDAAEQVTVDYEILPAVTDALAAMQQGAPPIWSAAPDNVALEAAFGDHAAVEAALARADVVVAQVFRNQRVANAQMEPRSVIGIGEGADRPDTLIAGCQSAHRLHLGLRASLGLPAERLRVICPDVGGGFGPRTNPYPEQIVALWASRRIGRPVKWTSDRNEAFLTDYQGRDMVTRARLGFDRAGRMLAYALELIGNVGAQTVTYVPLSNALRVAPTVYDIPLMAAHVRAVITNTAPTAPFRGAGRPEATLAIERLIDMAAHRLDIDRVELRRRNLIRRSALPYRTASGLTYDSGDFAGTFERTLEAADWNGFADRRKRSKANGRRRGIGIGNYVETPVGAPHERAEIAVSADGTVGLAVGTQSTGQGHETSFAQVVADLIGVAPEDVRFVSGDTAAVASGGGTHSDRSMRMAGTMMVQAGDQVVAQARRVAAALLGAPESAVEFADGLFRAPNSNRRLSVIDIARAIDQDNTLPAELRTRLAAVATFTGRIPAYPTGAAVCELEVDPETGAIELCRYTSIDDAGQPINPLILHGQVHGGIAQGVGQALMEAITHDPDSGDVLTASFMDYGIPRADTLPMFEVALTEDPTKGNPLRVKGGGEAGITPALAVVMNALIDALAEDGVEHLDMPATPLRVWQAIRRARP